jgi:hypothetical protein
MNISSKTLATLVSLGALAIFIGPLNSTAATAQPPGAGVTIAGPLPLPITVDKSSLITTSDTFVVDQSNSPGCCVAGAFDYKLLGLAQSFTPTFSSLDIVELLLGSTSADEPSSTVQVRIRSGSVSGAVLGESAQVTVTPPFLDRFSSGSHPPSRSLLEAST